MNNAVITDNCNGVGFAAAQHFCNGDYRVLVIAMTPKKLG